MKNEQNANRECVKNRCICLHHYKMAIIFLFIIDSFNRKWKQFRNLSLGMSFQCRSNHQMVFFSGFYGNAILVNKPTELHKFEIFNRTCQIGHILSESNLGIVIVSPVIVLVGSSSSLERKTTSSTIMSGWFQTIRGAITGGGIETAPYTVLRKEKVIQHLHNKSFILIK